MCLHILACLFPPLAVCFKKGGCCNSSCLLNLLLTIFGYFPGCIHACCVVSEEDPKVFVVGQAAPVTQNVVLNVGSPSGNGQGQGGYPPQPQYYHPQYAMTQQPQQQPPYNPYPTASPHSQIQMPEPPPTYKA